MKNLFELTTDIYLDERYCVTTDSPLLFAEKVYNNRCIIDAIKLCNEFTETHTYYSVKICDNETGEILYEKKSSQGDMPKSTVVYTYNVVFDHLAELLEKEMDF